MISYFADQAVAENEDVLVMGEFNNWFPEVMSKQFSKQFEFRVRVPSGYKYRYQFIVNGEITIDSKQDNSESKLGRLTNYQYALKKALAKDQPEIPKLSMMKMQSYIHPTMKEMYVEQF